MRIFLIAFLVTIQSIILFAQNNINSIKYSNRNGLSSNTVYCIHQDNYGFMWFGTDYGLNRFDGIKFTTYLYDAQDSNSISGIHTKSLFSDKKNRVWLQTENAYEYFDYADRQFHQKIHFDTLKVYIKKDFKQNLYFIKGKELYKYNYNTEVFDYLVDVPYFNSNSFFDKQNRLWILLSNQKKLYRSTDSTYTQFIDKSELLPSELPEKPESSLQVFNYFKEEYLQKGIEKSYSQVLKNIPYRKSLDFLAFIKKDSQNRQWTSDHQYLTCYLPDSSEINIMQNVPFINFYEDKNNHFWLGTSLNGVYFFSNKLNNFNKHLIFEKTTDKVNAFWEQNDSIVWIATNGNGLIKYNLKTKEKQILTRKNTKLYNDYVYCIEAINDNLLLIGTPTGLLSLNPQTNNLKKIFPQYQGASKVIKKINSQKVILNLGNNAYELNLTDWSLKQIKEINFNNLLIDKKQRIWLTSIGGVYQLSKDYRLLNFFKPDKANSNSISHRWTRSIAEDKNGTIWIGTGDGLNRYDEKNNHFTRFSIADGLPSNVIMAIICDDNNILWLSTQNGICRFNPQTKEVSNYDLHDNLQGMNFMGASVYKTRKNRIYFGGTNGFNVFFPRKISKNTTPPDIQITSFWVNNEVQTIRQAILNHSIYETQNIELKYDENSFAFEFIALNYVNPQKNTYKYQLIGFDKQPTSADYLQNKAKYTNIPPGKYTFYVTATNNSGIQNSEGQKIHLIIYPPFWQTWWFRGLIFSIIAGGIVMIYFWQMSQMKKQNLLLEKKVEKRTEQLNSAIKKLQEQKSEIEQQNEEIRHQNDQIKTLNNAKIQFFTNISHEFRTPLTLIMAPLQKIITSTKEKNTKENAQIALRNAQKNKQLVDELLDFRKIESGKMPLHFSKQNIIHFMQEIVKNFDVLMAKKSINFSFTAKEKVLDVYFDPRQFEKIMNNLLSNAYKFTQENGKIEIFVEKENNEIQIIINNTGIGIKKEYITKIFTRYYQIDSYQTINELKSSGIGLALTKQLIELHQGKIYAESDENKGTTFTISLPLGHNHLTDYELKNEKEFALSSNEYLIDKIPQTKNEKIPLKNDNRLLIQIVEDNHEIGDFLTNELKNDYQIIYSENGKIAYESIKKHIPDLIISDIMMPEMDGIELCKKIKTTEETSHIPVILLTAKTSVESQFEGLNTGADAYMSKPFYIEILKVRIQSLLRNRELIRQKYQNSQEIVPKELSKNNLDNQFIEKTIAIIQKNVSNTNFNSDILYQELGMSRAGFYRKLKALTGESVANFIRTVRLKVAKEQLTPDKQISEIAYQTGFNNLSYFTKSFKNQFGITPRKYLQQIS